ncbi:MAG TPA: hypothetical protein VFH88_02840 [Candidatus Krumholzibacteria bacterium]|nr:hypothetical protein [Candidatus Krumholzibacteria bacterium]
MALASGGSLASYPGAALRWLGMMIAPGAAIYLLSARSAPRVSGLVLSALVVSPVVTTVLGIAGLGLHVPVVTIAGAISALSLVATALALMRVRVRLATPDRRSVVWLAALLTALVVLTAYLPMTRAWWRIRSDAWFHAGVVAQISDFGIPPQDPYFAGLALQYMWFYHVLVLVLARGMDVDPLRVMAFINIQALLGLGVAAWQLTGVFRASRVHRLGGTAMMLLGFNGAFWVFLPVKLIRVVTGEVRGLAELKRTYSIVPFDYTNACKFMNIYYNQEFFLDKYMVATAFGIALAFMVACWYGAADYLRTRRPAPLVLMAIMLIGLLGFHSLVGFVMLVGIFGGAILALLSRRNMDPIPIRTIVWLLGVSLACFLASGPYLYDVMHLKEKTQVFPLSVSLQKTIGIFVSCAFALALVVWRRPMFRDRTPQSRFFLLGALSVTVFCLLIRLPGPNTYDKLGYLVFLPLAIMGGIALGDVWLDRAGRSRRWIIAGIVAFMLPVNALAFASCFATPDEVMVTPAEAALSIWLRDHTARDAVLVDDADRVVFLVTVPRRYLWGCRGYAQQWGYPRLEMSRRFHMRRALYSPGELDATTLGVLGSVTAPLYVIVRPEHHAAHAAVLEHPDLFTPVYSQGGYGVMRVDTQACRALASQRTDQVSNQELLRESGF